MFVTEISRYKGSTVCVMLSNGQKSAPLYIHRSIADRYSLSEGMEITAAQVRTIKRENDVRRARERALYLAEDMERSYKMMFDKLCANYPEDICREVCDELKQRGIIDDRRYARRYCDAALKKYGEYRVKHELWKRGISSEIIDELLEDMDDESSTETALRFLRSHICRDREPYKEKKRLYDALARRGFSYDVITKAFAALGEEDEL